MALTEENGGGGMVMPVAPMYGGGGFGGGNNGFGGDGWWILLLFILLGGGRWGGMGGGFGGGGTDGLYPWMNQSNQISEGFQNQMLNDNITSIRDGICGGFAGVTQQLYTNQIADMQQNFALQSQFAQCCCENRAATQDLKYTVATEASATRTANANNTQAILDKLCALELEGVKSQLAQAQRDNVGLQNQLNMANLAASQTAQNVQIVDSIYNRLSTCPVGTVPVYGETPIFRCNNNNNGCGCGCNGGNF